VPTSKAQLEEFLKIYQSQIKTLEGIITDLRTDGETKTKQIMNLQEALIAIKSPEAYHDQRMDELGAPDEMSKAQKAEVKLRLETEQAWIRELEGPTFKTANDITDLLGGILMGEATQSESIHGNTES
jgi:peptidoglycan hydrolase CwlO-like protein